MSNLPLVVGSDTRQGLRDGGFGDAAGQRSTSPWPASSAPSTRPA